MTVTFFLLRLTEEADFEGATQGALLPLASSHLIHKGTDGYEAYTWRDKGDVSKHVFRELDLT